MITELRKMLKLDELKLNYAIEIQNFEGESFTFSVRAKDGNTQNIYEMLKEKLEQYQESEGDDIGYMDVSCESDYVLIFCDLGSAHDEINALHRLLYKIDEVSGIKSVVINELFE